MVSKKLVLKCPTCSQILYELEGSDKFVPAGKCMYCAQLLLFNPKKMIFESSPKRQIMAKMGFNEPPLKLKYGNEPVDVIVDGRRMKFKSKLEYRWAQHLDFLKMVGEIKDWFYEFHTFRGFPENQSVKEYTPDFLVRLSDNSFEYHETKGMLSAYDLKKFKVLFDERPYVKIIVVFWQKPKLSLQKRTKLERYVHRVIYNARQMLSKEPIDMS